VTISEDDMIHVTDTVVLNEREIKERFVRSIGSRSQNVDKNATAVELRVDIARSSLPPEVKDRDRLHDARAEKIGLSPPQ
jgi:protein subunit release factor B